MSKSVIVIGGGVSGLVAAATLAKNKGFKVTLLEADDHIGGRINTRKFGDYYMEFGAQWVHGEKDNQVYELVEPLGVLINELNRDPTNVPFGDLVFATQNGQVMNSFFNKRIGEIFKAIEEDDEESDDKRLESLGEFATKLFEDMNEESPVHGKETMSNAALDFLHRYFNVLDSADTWFQTSNSDLGEQFQYCEGNPTIAWKSPATFSSLLRVILDQSPTDISEIELPSWIELGKDVVEIIYSTTDDGLVTVSCKDGSVYRADHVLVTVSLGILKDRHSTLFIPNLPSKKQLAIENIGFGTVNKIYLEFESAWWDVENEEFSGVGLLWEDEVKNGNLLPESSEEELLQEYDGIPLWCRSLIGFNTVNSQNEEKPIPILQGWLSGVSSRFMETLDIDYVKESCAKVLKKFLEKQFDEIPNPINGARSTWFTNPFTKGSYSFRTVEAEKQDVWASDLALPILNHRSKPILGFAGEATHGKYHSTVNGAYNSGVREANRLLEYYK